MYKNSTSELNFENIVQPLHKFDRDDLKSKELLNKGYLHHKIITSQNMLSEAQIKNFFILKKSCIPFTRYSSFCILDDPMI